MHILYIAYSCMPNKGSEEKIGWNIPIQSAKTNQVCVLTKEEHRSAIETYLHEHNVKNIKFYYADIPAVYKKIFKGIAYSMRLNIWHKRAFTVAKEICQKENIQIIHQITPIEFRSIGDYGKIPNVKFVCGPIGGGEYIPCGLKAYAGGHWFQEHIRRGINQIYVILHGKKKTLMRCDALWYANRETKNYLTSVPCRCSDRMCQTEIGIGDDEILVNRKKRTPEEKCIFLVAGRLVYRKGHALLLDALSRLPEKLDYECIIVGSGSELQRLRKKSAVLGLESRVTFKERVPFAEMAAIYEKAHVLVMPSIRETTGSVLLEAMARGLPVVTANRFGGAVMVEQSAGWLYDGDTKEEWIQSLQSALHRCIEVPEEVAEKSEKARIAALQNTWAHKVERYMTVYKELL